MKKPNSNGNELLEKMGGPRRVYKILKAHNYDVTEAAVYKWNTRRVPPDWTFVLAKIYFETTGDMIKLFKASVDKTVSDTS